jgi:hypothetical protein
MPESIADNVKRTCPHCPHRALDMWKLSPISFLAQSPAYLQPPPESVANAEENPKEIKAEPRHDSVSGPAAAEEKKLDMPPAYHSRSTKPTETHRPEMAKLIGERHWVQLESSINGNDESMMKFGIGSARDL